MDWSWPCTATSSSTPRRDASGGVDRGLASSTALLILLHLISVFLLSLPSATHHRTIRADLSAAPDVHAHRFAEERLGLDAR